MLILAADGLYGSLTMVLQPKMLRTIIENTRETVRMGFSELKSFVQVFTIQDYEGTTLNGIKEMYGRYDDPGGRWLI